MNIQNIVAYFTLCIFFLIVFYMEYNDWICPNPLSKSTDCNGEGMPVRGTFPNEADSCPQIIEKISYASKAESNSVKWRRAMFLSIIIIIVIFALQLSNDVKPDWTIIFTCIIISFAILYFQFNWYSYHRYGVVEDNISKNLEKLKKFC